MISFSEYMNIIKRQLQTNDIKKTRAGAWGEILQALYENKRYLPEKEQKVVDMVAQRIKGLMK